MRDQSGQQLLVIPIEFLQKGHVSHFGFVERQVASTYVEEGSIYSGDMPVNLDDPVFAGEVVFVRAGELLLVRLASRRIAIGTANLFVLQMGRSSPAHRHKGLGPNTNIDQ